MIKARTPPQLKRCQFIPAVPEHLTKTLLSDIEYYNTQLAGQVLEGVELNNAINKYETINVKIELCSQDAFNTMWKKLIQATEEHCPDNVKFHLWRAIESYSHLIVRTEKQEILNTNEINQEYRQLSNSVLELTGKLSRLGFTRRTGAYWSGEDVDKVARFSSGNVKHTAEHKDYLGPYVGDFLSRLAEDLKLTAEKKTTLQRKPSDIDEAKMLVFVREAAQQNTYIFGTSLVPVIVELADYLYPNLDTTPQKIRRSITTQ